MPSDPGQPCPLDALAAALADGEDVDWSVGSTLDDGAESEASVRRDIARLDDFSRHPQGMPKAALVVLVARGESHLLPSGEAVIEGGDVLLTPGSPEAMQRTGELLARAPEAPDV
jgi:hypothetical protein